MSNIVLIKALAVAVRDQMQAKHELTDEEVGQIAAAAYEGAIQALERCRLAKSATVAVKAGAGTYHVGEFILGGKAWQQITKRPRDLKEALQMSTMAQDGRIRMIADPAQIERMVERGEWVRP